MQPKKISSEGLVLSKKNHGEGDILFTIFTKEFGKGIFLAKGIRKLKSRKRGHLDTFNIVSFSASRGDGIFFIEEAQVIKHFPAIKKSLKKTALAYLFLEAALKGIEFEKEEDQLFDLLKDYLERLEEGSGLRQMKEEFLGDFLTSLGFWTGDGLPPEPEVFLEQVLEKPLSSVRVGKRIQ